MTDFLKLRRKLKKKKPDFVRQEAHKRKRLSRSGWRAPKGMHSKMRRKLKARRKQPSRGYSSPRVVSGLTRQGLKQILIKTLKDLNKIKENEIIIIAKTVGLRKKLQLLEKIKELKLKVQNIKDVNQFIKQAKENLEKRKTKRKEKQKVKKEKQKVKKEPKKEKPKEEKPKEKKEETPKEKEKREKEEKRKILEKK